MLLKCDCYNSEADMIYGKGVRPHAKMGTGEYMCEMCYWVRTEAQGKRNGKKEKIKSEPVLAESVPNNKPFPECANGCEAIRHFGVGECENICPKKFDENGDPKNAPGISQ